MKSIAVVLCGSGFKDGSEIRESVALLWALSQQKVNVKCFAPDDLQTDVVNCLTGETSPGENRNMLVEAARIARGDIEALSFLNPSKMDALILPGGFGVAKNLCDFANLGSRGKVRPELNDIIEKFFEQTKPIGAICIAPVVLAMALKDKKLYLTLGNECEASQEIEKLGHTHKVCPSNSCIVDEKNRIVSSPAYMRDDAQLYEIFEGIQKLVNEVIRMA